MSKSKQSEAQIIGALKDLEAGRKAEDVARFVGGSKHTIYGWKPKYGGMDVSQTQEPKQLRDENVRLLRSMRPEDEVDSKCRTDSSTIQNRPASSPKYEPLSAPEDEQTPSLSHRAAGLVESYQANSPNQEPK